MKAAFLLISAALLAASTHAEDFVCPEPYGFYPNPNNCIKYYQCSDDVAIELVCELNPDTGNQMHYDDVNVWCEEPSKVDCGDRPICDANDQNCVEQTTPDPDAWLPGRLGILPRPRGLPPVLHLRGRRGQPRSLPNSERRATQLRRSPHGLRLPGQSGLRIAAAVLKNRFDDDDDDTFRLLRRQIHNK